MTLFGPMAQKSVVDACITPPVLPPLPIIYCFVNQQLEWGDVVSFALAEDGQCLAEHLSSSEWWARHDIGVTSDWKHENYREHYPDGYYVLWVDDARPGKCPGLDRALARNQELAAAKQEGAES